MERANAKNAARAAVSGEAAAAAATAAAFSLLSHRRPLWYLLLPLLAVITLWLLLFSSRPASPSVTLLTASVASPSPLRRCSGRYIYVQELPPRFNRDMIPDCWNLSIWTDLCQFSINGGLGPFLSNSAAVFSGAGWHVTDQFSLEVIFHSRMKNYPCLTSDSSLASAVYVPFYAGIDFTRHIWAGDNITVRDSTALDLVDWLTSRPEWAAMGGRDHFFICLLAKMYMGMSEPNDVSVPYPTYFHPSEDGEVMEWQERMRLAARPWLFSFAGAPRPNMADSIRGELMEQCRGSRRCKLLDCGGDERRCYSPEKVMALFGSSVFCLQPKGDSYTRRSAFDAMVAGCVPVFFLPETAYWQYRWHLPENGSRYSVLVAEEEVKKGAVRVEEVLMRLGEEEVRGMREEVVRMIPGLVYGNPMNNKMEKMKDAFDLAVERVIKRVQRRKRELRRS
ncbi:Xyloglucan galactosyltransferase KATAMARI1 like [Apostasia shenzhenica]|uniref:Xyloglucan galactosyltransferase KATAMARI1 like n=1 Tax=Apostasia shenzhenica TaxID=1088818 RepID=A0A2I0B291_9ASPA|nr:Xyloglucan galactosyltransferase KATAMARI1 like [Apostasia shenzhenica]